VVAAAVLVQQVALLLMAMLWATEEMGRPLHIAALLLPTLAAAVATLIAAVRAALAVQVVAVMEVMNQTPG
jgi:hypothetical protein